MFWRRLREVVKEVYNPYRTEVLHLETNRERVYTLLNDALNKSRKSIYICSTTPELFVYEEHFLRRLFERQKKDLEVRVVSSFSTAINFYDAKIEHRSNNTLLGNDFFISDEDFLIKFMMGRAYVQKKMDNRGEKLLHIVKKEFDLMV